MRLGAALTTLMLAACGGATPTPEPVEAEPVAEAAPEPLEAEPAPEAEPPEPEAEPDPPSAPEPEFTEGMSVSEAINAVPQGAARINLDADELAEPLREYSVYEPCKPRPNQHWTLRVAVWEGRAVGVDVKTTPKSDALAECIKEKVREVRWKKALSVASLNTVEAGF